MSLVTCCFFSVLLDYFCSVSLSSGSTSHGQVPSAQGLSPLIAVSSSLPCGLGNVAVCWSWLGSVRLQLVASSKTFVIQGSRRSGDLRVPCPHSIPSWLARCRTREPTASVCSCAKLQIWLAPDQTYSDLKILLFKALRK